jgi:leucyl-tRNA synthetase
MNPYDHKELDAYWQKKWEEEKIYTTNTTSSKPKFYGLVEFPYPSGSGLHVGHVRSYTGMDIIARKRRMEGYEVLFPMGWDAFGLPAENYAIKTGIHPSITTRENIEMFRSQLKALGFSFDWDREVDTTDPTYYKWSQWIFLKLYEKGLAYKKEMPVNWCPKDKCVLANEEVIDGTCERCGAPVEKRNKEQWMLAITKYAERLDKDLDDTTYLDKIKIQQRNWIGMSEGSEIDFTIKAGDFSEPLPIFTTRADTLFGCTYCVLAPEHPLVKQLLAKDLIANKDEVAQYVKEAVQKIDIDRSAEGKEKTGIVLAGVTAINPGNKDEVPVYIADYVLPAYGTGAIMAVPAHDERDYAFAKEYNIPVKQVIVPCANDPHNPPKPELEEVKRDTVIVHLRDTVTGKFALLDWHGTLEGITTAIMGGIESGQTPEEAALTEIREEAALEGARIIKKLPWITAAKYCASHKNENRCAHTYSLLAEIDGIVGQGAIADEEKKKHTLVWVEEAEVPTRLTPVHQKQVWQLLHKETPLLEDGYLINSGIFDGLTGEEAKKKITESVGGKVIKKSKLRDWVFARQRYWGEPIPLVYDEDGKMYPVHESELPIVLPQVDKYEPTDNGESPLYQVPEWVHVTGSIDDAGFFHAGESADAKKFRRETDTMPQWAGSSWYFMRYIDPRNDTAIGDKEMLAKWLPVDWYNGGMEHTTLHLLYSRFWYKFLFDIGIVPTNEPYMKRTSQGMILGEGGVKMSKSLGNVVNPMVAVEAYGADALRLYEMFIGPFDQAVAWDSKAIVGVKRFLDKVYSLQSKVVDGAPSLVVTHKTIKQVTEQIDSMAFNTCVSQLMICANEYEKAESVSKENYTMFLRILAPFAPHITEELWHNLGNTDSIHKESWPAYDESKLVESEATISLQINGKLRGTFIIPMGSDEKAVLEAAKSTDGYQKYVGEVEPKKVIIVENRLINIVI